MPDEDLVELAGESRTKCGPAEVGCGEDVAGDEDSAPAVDWAEVEGVAGDELAARGEAELRPLLDELAAARKEAPEVGAWFVSAAEKDTFRRLEERWNKLQAWGVGDKLKGSAHGQSLREWQDFSARWRSGDEEPKELGYHGLILNTVENHARDLGYEKPAGQVAPPDPEKEHPILAAIDRGAKVVEQAGIPLPTANAPAEIRQAVEDAGAAAKRSIDAVPTKVWIAGGLALLAVGGLALSKALGEATKLAELARGGAT